VLLGEVKGGEVRAGVRAYAVKSAEIARVASRMVLMLDERKLSPGVRLSLVCFKP